MSDPYGNYNQYPQQPNFGNPYGGPGGPPPNQGYGGNQPYMPNYGAPPPQMGFGMPSDGTSQNFNQAPSYQPYQQPMTNYGNCPPPNQVGMQPYGPPPPDGYNMGPQNVPYNQNQSYDPNNPHQQQQQMTPYGQVDDRGFGTALMHGGIFGKVSKVFGGLSGGDSIKELLKTAASQAVKILGITDGYFTHNIVKILLPVKLNGIASIAKKFRLDSYIEKFILSMNRAAEQAASAALPIFERFISSLSVNDMACMVGAEGSAATQYFRQQTERDLEQAYTPIVVDSMNNWQVTRNFNEIQEHTRHIPGIKNLHVDIHDYTIKGALKGLFHVLGDQETKLRADPKGQVTNIFGKFFHQ